ncbi:MAG: formylglycine-generating enzyme family protein [Deltaproteobacteria bacterium]|nr:formylglycine-generating enzyme family protein [Deltaproteobacteria bacterium]
MKKIFILCFVILSGTCVILSAAKNLLAQESNPYHEGTERTQLTAEEKENLLQYLTSSKATLERAKKKAKDKSLEEVFEIYTSSIKDVVLRSSQSEKSRGELLLRYALNQALELTVGIPTSDGKGVEKEGVLAHGPIDLNIAILENSIDFALSYYPKDKEAVDSGSLLNLPFFEFSQKRLLLAREWLTGIHSWKSQLEFEVATLEQWFLTVKQEQNLEKERIASLILDVDEALTKVKSQIYTVGQKVRFLRGVIRQVLEDGQILREEEDTRRRAEEEIRRQQEVERRQQEVERRQQEEVRRKEEQARLTEKICAEDFVGIPAGTFMMGSPSNETNRGSNEAQHQVTLTQDFQMMKTEVTQKMWVSIMSSNPSYFKGDNLPVEQVSWNDVKVFIEKLNQKNDGYTYRLPTEEEWEYAARAGATAAYSFGDNAAVLGDYGWFSGNSGNKTHPVGQKNPNAFGLYDMHGGSWYGSAQSLRSAVRIGIGPGYRSFNVGFRLVRTKSH